MSDDQDSRTVSHAVDVLEGRAPMDPALRAELERMLCQHHRKVRAVVLRVVRDPDLADDVTQEALETALRRLPSFEGRSSLSTWVCGIGRNLALNRVREKRPSLTEDGVVDPRDPETSVLSALSRAEREHVMREATAGLEPLEQEVVYLRYTENLPREVVAEMLGLEGGAEQVRVILNRVTRHLKKELTRRLSDLGHSMSFVRTTDVGGTG
jgi:RNA polymerase sigma-70 factor (ECF subfamily)